MTLTPAQMAAELQRVSAATDAAIAKVATKTPLRPVLPLPS